MMAIPLGVVDALAEWSAKESGGLQEKWPDMLRVMEVHLCSVCRSIDIFTIFFSYSVREWNWFWNF